MDAIKTLIFVYVVCLRVERCGVCPMMHWGPITTRLEAHICQFVVRDAEQKYIEEHYTYVSKNLNIVEGFERFYTNPVVASSTSKNVCKTIVKPA